MVIGYKNQESVESCCSEPGFEPGAVVRVSDPLLIQELSRQVLTVTYSQATKVSSAKATGPGGSGTWTLLEVFMPLLPAFA